MPLGRASRGIASPFMFWAALIPVKTEVSSSISPLSLAAKTESMSFISASCCSILSPFARLELRKNTLNSLVQILSSTDFFLLSQKTAISTKYIKLVNTLN